MICIWSLSPLLWKVALLGLSNEALEIIERALRKNLLAPFIECLIPKFKKHKRTHKLRAKNELARRTRRIIGFEIIWVKVLAKGHGPVVMASKGATWHEIMFDDEFNNGALKQNLQHCFALIVTCFESCFLVLNGWLFFEVLAKDVRTLYGLGKKETSRACNHTSKAEMQNFGNCFLM